MSILYCYHKEKLELFKYIDLIKTFAPIFLVILGIKSTAFGQDLIFSQFYNAPLTLNPAFAGTSENAQFSGNYRLQWPNVSKAYESYALGYNQFFRDINSGFGLSVIADNSGDGAIQHLSVGATYMYKVILKGNYQLKIGVEAALAQNRLDWTKLTFGDQFDNGGPIFSGGSIINTTEIPPDNFNKGYLDIATGFLVYNNSWYAGLTLKHLNNPNNGFLVQNNNGRLGLPMLINLHGGYQYVFDIGNKQTKPSFISPSVLVAKQGDFWQINAGTYVQLKSFIAGAYFRHTVTHGDAVITAFGVNLDPIKITYSFDLTISALGLATGGSHEIGIIYNLVNNRKQQSNLNDCFLLFK